MNTAGTANARHAAHLDHIKTLASAEERRAYIEDVRRDDGRFFSEWLSEDFTTWWASNRKKETP